MNAHRAVALVVCLLAMTGLAFAQHRVDAGRMYERIYAIVPMVGSGTLTDPKRPMFAPTPQQAQAQALTLAQSGTRAGIIAFNSVISDDGNFALVEIVTATKSDMASVKAQITTQITSQVTATATRIQLFDRATSTPAVAEAAFKLLKKDFDINKFRVVVP